jgi:hypothetical protein
MENKAHTTPVMHSFTEKKSIDSPMKAIVSLVLIAVLGIGTGYALATFSAKTGTKVPLLPTQGSDLKGQSFGSGDTSTFKDTAEGKLVEGGVEGEGQYHLERAGGDSQNVYLTSSLVDMSKFLNKKIKVWGETQKAEKAGWLMDVGKVEVLE